MDKFKIGDKVEVVEKYNEYKVGEVGIITSTNHTYYRINGDTWGALGHYFKKVEYKPMFKIGDKVKVTKRAGYFGLHSLDIGGVYEISEEYTHNGFRLKAVGKSIDSVYNFVHKDEIEMYQDFEYEDQWHLNDGKVEIPGDADKLEKDGSVVAFRKRISPKYKFGDILIGKCTGTEYRFIKYDNTGISKNRYATLLNSLNSIVQVQNLDNYKLKTND